MKIEELKLYAKKFEGVEVHGKSIRVVFPYKGQRCREVLRDIELSKGNIRFASNKRASIMLEICSGTFDYREHFPNSKNAEVFSPRPERPKVKAAVIHWLEIKKPKTAPSTFRGYESKARNHVLSKWGDIYADEVTQSGLEHWISVELSDLSNKTINDILTPFRGAMKALYADGAINKNPFEHIENLTVIRDDPDPFTRKEIARIMETPTLKQSEINAFDFSCWSGLSLSEMLAVAWQDVDWETGKVKIARANVHGLYKVPKEKRREREVELLEPALEALKRQKSISFMLPYSEIEVLQRDNKTTKKELVQFVFVKTSVDYSEIPTGYPNDNQFREGFFIPHLKKAGVRYRGPNNARHTYASQLLTALVPPEWIANQMGHTSTAMLRKHYAKWMKEEAPSMTDFVNGLLGFDQNAPREPQRNLGLG